MRLASDEPQVSLVKVFETPFDNAVATARTCYSSRLISDADVQKKPELRDRIARSIYLAGHHTTLQHAHFQFTLDKVSRQALWSFFHAHPFYNSEQVSQRYVEVKAGRVLVPAFADAALAARYEACVARQMESYQRLREELEPAVAAVYFGVFPARKGRDNKRYAGAVKKKCQEVARYVLPVATHAHLYHTISGLTLHRYHRVAQSPECPTEQRLIIEQMVAQVSAHDPLFFRDQEAMLALEDTHEARLLSVLNSEPTAFRREFDTDLAGRSSRLVDMTREPAAVLGAALREAFGVPRGSLSDDEATALLLDPAKSPYLGEALALGTLSKGLRALELVSFTFQKKLSHSADSQAQRHRMTPGARPQLSCQQTPGEPDYIAPAIFQHELASDAKARYDDEMARTWDDIAALARGGAAPEAWQYLLPNAVAVRFSEAGSLLDLHHKWTTRLCYNAQEEIWSSTLDEVKQVSAKAPSLGRWLLPPCGLRERAGTRPVCPEGERFCGVKVWRLPPSEWARIL
jgi:thymidylate synthase ThyX